VICWHSNTGRSCLCCLRHCPYLFDWSAGDCKICELSMTTYALVPLLPSGTSIILH